MEQLTEEKAIRLQIMGVLGWNKPKNKYGIVPGVILSKENDKIFGVLCKPYCISKDQADLCSHVYFFKDEFQQLILEVTENRFFDPNNVGKLLKKSHIALTVFENGHPVWNSKKSIKDFNYGANLLKVSNCLLRSMQKQGDFWEDPLSQNIRKTLLNGLKMEKQYGTKSNYAYSMSRLIDKKFKTDQNEN